MFTAQLFDFNQYSMQYSILQPIQSIFSQFSIQYCIFEPLYLLNVIVIGYRLCKMSKIHTQTFWLPSKSDETSSRFLFDKNYKFSGYLEKNKNVSSVNINYSKAVAFQSSWIH